jgi:sigma-54 dependent transcriptional regulator, acetoin dehydrogenase operon transcriptional activator AcoR
MLTFDRGDGMPEMVVSRFDDFKNLDKILERNWERFLVDGLIPNENRKIIKSSWERCLRNQVDPLKKEAKVVYEDSSLLEKKEQHQFFLDLALPYMEEMFRYFNDEDMILVLSDQDGIILEGKANAKMWRILERHRFYPGADWSEQVAGTNAIGTALLEGKPVQIFSAEHFCQGWHPWVCSAAPIRDPLTQQIIGVLNMTGKKKLVQAHDIYLVVSQVQKIQQTIGFHLMQQNIFSFESVLDKIHEPFVIFDMDGRITRHNDAARFLLGIKIGERMERYMDTPIHRKDLKDLSNKGMQAKFRGKNGMEWRIRIQPYKMGAHLFGGMAIFQKMGSKTSVQVIPKGNSTRYCFENLLTKEPMMIKLIKLARKASFSDKNVLITGETGTGKEILAQSIHTYGPRQHGPFVGVNCGAIPRDLVASELFGYEGGAFTGAKSQGKKGKFLLAHKGTIFLDEIGDLPLDAQVCLLRVLEERAVFPVGGTEPIPVDVRVIAATHKDLEKEIEKGNFREDLYHRLNVISLSVPPLRERRGDIPLLVESFLRDACEGMEMPQIEDEVWRIFHDYRWPGNIRQLKNVVEKAIFHSDGEIIMLNDLPQELLVGKAKPSTDTINNPKSSKWTRLKKKQLTRDILEEALQETKGSVSEAARLLNVSRMTIYRKMKEFGLE